MKKNKKTKKMKRIKNEKKVIKTAIPNIRMLYEMIEVIYDREWLKNSTNIELYYMYRGMYINEIDRIKIEKHNLRYDITIIPPLMLGCEFVKTAGHYHKFVPGTYISFPEIYEVLSGNGCFLMQKPNGNRLEDVVMIKAGEGDKIIVPPGYGHITINASNHMLITANWVANNKESLYDPIKDKKGGAYYILRDANVKNNRYNIVPEIRILEPTNFDKIGLKKSDGIYKLVEYLERLEFLTCPQRYRFSFEEIFI